VTHSDTFPLRGQSAEGSAGGFAAVCNNNTPQCRCSPTATRPNGEAAARPALPFRPSGFGLCANRIACWCFASEIRAGAAWGLGEQQNSIALTAITKSFNSVDESIRVEATRALAKFTSLHSGEILDIFGNANSHELPGIAWALSKSDNVHLDQLITKLSGTEFRQWIAYIIGMQGEERYVSEIEKLKDLDSEVYFAATFLWKIIPSWVHELKEY